MKIDHKSAGRLASLSLLLGLTVAGAAGCSNDSPSDSTPDLFTPTPLTAPLRLRSVEDLAMPSKGSNQYLVDVKLSLDSLGKEADFVNNEINDCQVSVAYAGEELVPGGTTSLVDAQKVDVCRTGDKADDLGIFVVGSPKKSGKLDFTIKMYNVEGKMTVRGFVSASIPSTSGGTVSAELVAIPVP
jgi:hypothetical protein